MAKILIVDDEPDHSASLSKVLQAKGHQVATAPNGREALAQVLNNPPDVILLDLLMPEMDGPSFLDVVRSYLRLGTLPVVVLTGVPESPLVDRTEKGRSMNDERLSRWWEVGAREGPADRRQFLLMLFCFGAAIKEGLKRRGN